MKPPRNPRRGTAERKSAALAVRVEWIDLENAICQIPAMVRKGKRKPAIYRLWPELVTLLQRAIAHAPRRELVWPWPFDNGTFYNHFDRIAKDAEWPLDRKHRVHCLRASHATHLMISGGDATRALMHSDPAITKKHYIDARLLPPDDTKLFIPWLEPRS